MSSPTQPAGPVGPDTLITVKVIIDGQNRRFKLALRDLGAHVLPQKLRFLLAVPPEADVKFDRFSDSAGAYITLDSTNPAIYKQLYRAAKAKLKLRLRATVTLPEANEAPKSTQVQVESPIMPPPAPPKYEPLHYGPSRPSYLQTVLAPSSHGNRSATSASPSVQPLQTPVVSGLSSTDAAQRNEMADRAKRRFEEKLRLEAEYLAAKEKPTGPRDFILPARPKQPSLMDTLMAASFAIDCNNCSRAIANEHYHCSICDSGDFDLCQACVDAGVSCDGKDHWLIKRFQQGGNIIPSITETIAPKAKTTEELKTAHVTEQQPDILKTGKYQGDRTCNSCINEYPGEDFLSCENCPDFDLCIDCFASEDHGHHPGHSFRPVSEEKIAGAVHIQAMCDAGRGVVHEALCDGCDKTIIGIRYKCLNCPDWDYCSTCYLSSAQIHPGHRFAPLYEALITYGPRPETHFGIYCDGPLCAVKCRKNYIRGDRFKCAVCDDTDFCANCEATPTNGHNKTHPLIKFRTPVRHVSVTTLGENNGQPATQMGDKQSVRLSTNARNASTETAPPAANANAATQVQTVAEVKPTDSKVEEKDLQAWFESDTTPDGSEFAPNRLVAQSWTIRNPGPHTWPAGCAVYYVGGDDMRNLDTKRPSSVSEVDPASHSNILETSLEPHQTAVFKVLLKSPAREGRVISYWRLKTKEGKPFGHKLWVDITVANKAEEEPKKVEIEDEALGEETQQTSQMIFPKLEKESPVSSVQDVRTTAASAVIPEPEPMDDLLDDVDSLESDDGFMTDEEYDILDASDEDYLMAQSEMVARK